jgi:hypothetical protein
MTMFARLAICLTLALPAMAADEQILVSPLSGIQKDAVGILSPEGANLPRDFWRYSTATSLAKQINPYIETAPAAVSALMTRIMLAELSPPVSEASKADLLIARLNYLSSAGQLEAVEALLSKAGPNDPYLFPIWFNTALISKRTSAACLAMAKRQSLAPNLESRVFCLARGGDWDAAALTLRMGGALGSIDEYHQSLLERFLDPELYEGDLDPGPPAKMTPLIYALRDALALPIARLRLPLAYQHSVISGHMGWQNRLFATERLVRSGAINPDFLKYQYLEGKPSASGGIWDRVSAFQKLNEAIENKDAEAISKHVSPIYNLFKPLGLLPALAEITAPALLNLDVETLQNPYVFNLLSLSVKGGSTIDLPLAENAFQTRLLDVLNDTIEPGGTALEVAIHHGLTWDLDKTPLSRTALDGQSGTAVLSAINLLRDGFRADPSAIAIALVTLRAADLDQDARAIAVELMVMADNSV